MRETNTKRCHLCGRDNSPEAENCSRCGGKLQGAPEKATASRLASTKQALTACRACGQVVARNVNACPHCGKRLRTLPPVRVAALLAILGLLSATLFYAC